MRLYFVSRPRSPSTVTALKSPPTATVAIFPRHLQMNPARVRAALLVDVEEGLDLGLDRRHVSRLEAVAGRVGVAVDGVADPKPPFLLPSLYSSTEGKCSRSLSADMRVINVTLPGTFFGLSVSRIYDDVVGSGLVADFHPNRVLDASHEFEMSKPRLPRPFSDPQQMRANSRTTAPVVESSRV